MMIYPGATVRQSVTFQLPDAITYFDPGAIVMRLKPALGGAETSWTYGVDGNMVRDGLGRYHCDVIAGSPGLWQFRWIATTGAIVTMDEGYYTITASPFA